MASPDAQPGKGSTPEYMMRPPVREGRNAVRAWINTLNNEVGDPNAAGGVYVDPYVGREAMLSPMVLSFAGRENQSSS